MSDLGKEGRVFNYTGRCASGQRKWVRSLNSPTKLVLYSAQSVITIIVMLTFWYRHKWWSVGRFDFAYFGTESQLIRSFYWSWLLSNGVIYVISRVYFCFAGYASCRIIFVVLQSCSVCDKVLHSSYYIWTEHLVTCERGILKASSKQRHRHIDLM